MEKLAKNHRLFIVSNSQKGYPELCIEKLGLTGLIQGHLCFGDTQGDYEATLEAGVPFIWAAYGFGTPDGYDHKIDSFADLPNLTC